MRARNVVVRALAFAALVVPLPTLYFTYGRGAWLALAAGVVAALALERARLRMLARLLVLSARKRDPSTIDELTPQELPIARLVGEGNSNKDMAAQPS